MPLDYTKNYGQGSERDVKELCELLHSLYPTFEFSYIPIDPQGESFVIMLLGHQLMSEQILCMLEAQAFILRTQQGCVTEAIKGIVRQKDEREAEREEAKLKYNIK